jgi:hypothetical protein
VLGLVNESLSHELFDILDVLFINNFGQHSESICLENIVVDELNILGEARYDYKHLIFINMQFFYQHVNQTPQVLVKFVPL